MYANSWEQKKLLTYERSSPPTGFVWNTNIAAALLFWNTNMAAVMSRENALLDYRSCHWWPNGWPFSHFATTMLCWGILVEGPCVCHPRNKVVNSGSEIFTTCEERKEKKKVVYISLLNTNSWHVVRISGIVYEKSSSERLFGISSHRGACSSSSCCNLK